MNLGKISGSAARPLPEKVATHSTLSFAMHDLIAVSMALSLPGPAVVPPTAAKALLKKVAMFCSLAVGGRPPTYIRLACRVACCDGG